MARVLIGIVTFERDIKCLDELQDAIRNQSFKDFDVLFVDNSATDSYKRELESRGFKVVKDGPEGTTIDKIMRGRTILRQACLDGGYEYLFFMDGDVISPPFALERLLKADKDVCSGLFMTTQDDGKTVAPCLWALGSPGKVRMMTTSEVEDDRLMQIAIAGFGCCLIKRKVLEAVSIRNIGTSAIGGEDTAFFKDVYDAGMSAFVDTSVRCLHRLFKKGDARNGLLDAMRYKRPKLSYSFNASVG